ncbi:alpha/beta fold hydrolase [Actinomadura harenae]|uniref:Alpha/beta fold hydrolase n=1 Tax=Actinomadura harenae TaxID=2483351 RepID=A0A3M2LSU7_9ACTN|nr:alpha/beta hydrolase [Actinomadura harenae]RMI39940.1 alpha/beta fold hydrolase [Actinomadura harenae]
MPISEINGIRLSHEVHGTGTPVLLVAGTGAPGRVWRTHQVPALLRAGFQVITMDNRGIAPSDECAGGFTLDDMAADCAGLIEHLGVGPCAVVGFSLGAIVTQELLIARPDLVREAVLIATRGRTDPLGAAASRAELELFDSGVKLPPSYEAVTGVMRGFSRATLNDPLAVRDWLDVFELSPVSLTASRAQLTLDVIPDRLPDLGRVRADCLVIGFSDDLVAPPHFAREVADHIPSATFLEIADCGHYGHLENPEAVNAALIGFLGT